MNKINKQITESKNRGLFNKLVEEIKKYPFMLEVKTIYKNGFVFYTITKEKNWKEVYDLE